MAIPATERTVSETYDRIRKTLLGIKAHAPRYAMVLSSDVLVEDVEEVCNWLRSLLPLIPPSNLFPGAWLTALETYANSQMLTQVADWVAEYNTTQAALVTAYQASVAALPVDSEGFLMQYRVGADGTLTQATVPSASLATLAAALTALNDTIA